MDADSFLSRAVHCCGVRRKGLQKRNSPHGHVSQFRYSLRLSGRSSSCRRPAHSGHGRRHCHHGRFPGCLCGSTPAPHRLLTSADRQHAPGFCPRRPADHGAAGCGRPAHRPGGGLHPAGRNRSLCPPHHGPGRQQPGTPGAHHQGRRQPGSGPLARHAEPGPGTRGRRHRSAGRQRAALGTEPGPAGHLHRLVRAVCDEPPAWSGSSAHHPQFPGSPARLPPSNSYPTPK